MAKFAQNRQIAYAVFWAIIFLIIITRPGMHDSSFRISLLAYVAINILFSVWILRVNILLRILCGIIVAFLSLVVSYNIQSLFFSILSDPITAGILFAINYIGVFVGIWELILFICFKKKNRALK